ncbi:MAG: xylulokinase, partial [Clostridia bacterium]|nr:xylulokinase [Clostridia bacterium]
QSSTIYFDIHKKIWWQEMLDFVGMDKKILPEVIPCGEVVGEYEGIKVVTGAIDQIAGAIGAGIVKKGVISEMTGTTMVVFVPTDNIPDYNPDSKTPCHINYDGKYCLLAWTATAGIALKWFKNNFCENFKFSELDALAEKVPEGSAGLTFLPYLCGAVMPKYNPDARGVFCGITMEHTRGHFVRSILEAVACMLKGCLDYIKSDCTEIRTMGGGAMSPLWCQIKADMTGKTFVTLKNDETACLGSAILAGTGVGVFESVEKAVEIAVKPNKVYKPSGKDYTECYERYKKLDETLWG